MTEPLRDDFDSPWKNLLEKYFRQFMEFFFSKVARDIDWSQEHEFLDKELQQIVREADLGRRYADKLVRVKQMNGNEAWVLVHIEIQGDKDPGLEKRMFVYHYRIFDRYEKKVASFALLADTNEKWRPSEFNYGLWGCSIDFRFPTAKLLDFKDSEPASTNPPNPFSVAVAAHLKAKATHDDMEKRLVFKWAIVRSLYQAGFDRTAILELFRFIDWVMALSPELDERFKSDFLKFEEEQKVPYVTSIERIAVQQGKAEGKAEGITQGKAEGKAEGITQGKAEGITQGKAEGKAEGLIQAVELGLKLKFGIDGLKILPEIKRIKDCFVLETICSGIESAKTVEELGKIYKDA